MPKKKKVKIKDALVIYLEDKHRQRVQSQFSDSIELDDVHTLYRAFVEDTISACLGLEDCDLIVSCASDSVRKVVQEAIASLESGVRGKNKNRCQRNEIALWQHADSGVSKNFEETFHKCFDNGYERVLLIDCVTPTITRRMLTNAFESLHKTDVVFGPTLEGSYYLLGMRRPIDEIFTLVDWSETENIYRRMVEVAEEKKLDWQELELWYDLRQPGDLEYLVRDINTFRIIGDEASARRTEAVLETLLQKLPGEET